MESGIRYSSDGRLLQVRTRASGHCVTGHIWRVWGQSVAFIQRIHCLGKSGHCWIWGCGPQERWALPTAVLLMLSGQLSKAKGVDSRSHLGEMVWYKEAAGLKPQSLHYLRNLQSSWCLSFLTCKMGIINDTCKCHRFSTRGWLFVSGPK